MKKKYKIYEVDGITDVKADLLKSPEKMKQAGLTRGKAIKMHVQEINKLAKKYGW